MKHLSNLLLATALINISVALAHTAIVDLKCDKRRTPLGIDHPQPTLSWKLDSGRQGAAQTAYHIQAASSESALSDPNLWDSNWIESSNSTIVAYGGEALNSAQRVYWRVRIKDEKGRASDWSKPSWFETGLREDSDWAGARWISCDRQDQPQYAPDHVMGPWIAPEVSPATSKQSDLRYSLNFDLPDKPVVYAGAWWDSAGNHYTQCFVNDRQPEMGSQPGSIRRADFGFHIKPGRNTVQLLVQQTAKPTAVTFGMRIVFADGEERSVRSSSEWESHVQMTGYGKTKVVCDYGESPLGQAVVFRRAPIPATWYKKDLIVDKAVASARLYLCALGYGTPYLNGEKLGDHVLDPGQTDYEQFAHYIVYDVSNQLRQSQNALSVLVGDGWFNQDRAFSVNDLRYGKPGMRAFLRIRYEDGTEQKLISDESWKWKASETHLSNIYIGDRVDFRKAHDEWKTPGTPADWKGANEIVPLSPRLIAQDFPPMREIRRIEPIDTWQTGEKTWIIDLGENTSGWLALDFHEPEGSVIRVRCAEMLDASGKYLASSPHSFWSCHGVPQSHEIISDGKPRSWKPSFSYHGFRYAEVSGLTKAPQEGQIRGVVVHTDAPIRASFNSSDPLLNRMFHMGIQTHLINMHSILEDCPHREKCMWGGDLHSSWATGYYALDSASFYRQAIRLYFTPPFTKAGLPGNIGVGKRLTRLNNDFTWSVSPLFLAWRQYRMYGDLQTPKEHYDFMLRFLRKNEEAAPDLIPQEAKHGDHAHPLDIERVEQNRRLVAAMHFFAAANRFAELAAALGKEEDAAWSRELGQRIKRSIFDLYYNAEEHTFGNGMQDSLALAFDLVDPEYKAVVGDSLARVYQENSLQFDGGFMSYQIYPQLAENGKVDLAFAMLRNDAYPGLAWSIKNFDATTVWERYLLDRNELTRISLAHHAMNHPTAWMITHLAGIRAHPSHPGFQKILLEPYIPQDLDSVEATVSTEYGQIRSAWKKQGPKLRWHVTIPANSHAEVRIPEGSEQVQIDNKKSSQGLIKLAAGIYLLEWSYSQ